MKHDQHQKHRLAKRIVAAVIGGTVTLIGIALIVFRTKLPDAPRPHKTPLYPLTPILFVMAGLGIVVNTFIADRQNAVIGAAIIALGVPVYFLWKKFTKAEI